MSVERRSKFDMARKRPFEPEIQTFKNPWLRILYKKYPGYTLKLSKTLFIEPGNDDCSKVISFTIEVDHLSRRDLAISLGGDPLFRKRALRYSLRGASSGEE